MSPWLVFACGFGIGVICTLALVVAWAAGVLAKRADEEAGRDG